MKIEVPIIILLFVVFGVLFALSSCGESGTTVPPPALSNYSLTYDPISGVENKEIAVGAPKWEPQLASAVSYTSADLPTGLTLDAKTGV